MGPSSTVARVAMTGAPVADHVAGPDAEAEVAMDGAFDLVATLRASSPGWRRATVYDGTGVWRAVRTPDGPVTARLECVGARVTGRYWGPGASWAAARLAGWTGHADRGTADLLDGAGPPGALHPAVRRALRATVGRRWPRTGLVTSPVLSVVINQKVPARDARRSRDGVERIVAERAPGPAPARLLLPPDPGRVAALPDHVLHTVGLERNRAGTLRRVAARWRRLEEAADLDREGAERRLRAVAGVGPWTATKVLGNVLGHPDVVVVGDYNICHHVVFAMTGRRRGCDAEMLDLLAPYAGQRGRVQRSLLSATPSPPRRGPRLDPPDLRQL